MLPLFVPGAPREEYFERLAKLADQPMSEEERAAFIDRHDTYWGVSLKPRRQQQGALPTTWPDGRSPPECHG
jgi:hypothetical protein